MRTLIFILLSSLSLLGCVAESFSFKNFNLENGRSADAVFGQVDFVSNRNYRLGINGARLGKYVGPGSKHIVLDYDNNRVLIWNSALRSNTQSPDIVLGQPSFYTNQKNYPLSVPSASNFSGPLSAWSDGSKLVIADANNHRVLIWSTFPDSSYTPADVVLGQPDFISNTINNPSVSESTFSSPYNVHVTSGGRLYVADSVNNRVLFWNSIPTVSYAPADGVLGQPDFTTVTANTGARSASTLNTPTSVTSDDDQLYVADRKNNRVLIWNTNAPASSSAATYILGQSAPNLATVNSGGISYKSLSNPLQVDAVDSKLIVTDYQNNRILVWNPAPTSSFTDASVVIGQPDELTTNDYVGGYTAANVFQPWGTSFDGQYLFISGNQRLLAFNGIPATNGQSADFIYGQANDSYTLVNYGGVQSRTTLRGPYKISKAGKYSWVNDASNFRILQWNNNKTPFTSAPDIVIGQANFTETVSQTSQSGISNPRAVASDGRKLIVGDANRLLIWNSIPTSHNQNADVVIGQPDFITNTVNNSGDDASDLMTITDIHITADGKMVVADFGNNRVLVWNSIPTIDNTPADLVLGQADFTTSTANFGGLSGSSLSGPFGVFTFQKKLYVCDRANHRVLVWNQFPTTNNQSANFVIGQKDLISNSVQAGFATGNSVGLNSPTAVVTNGKRFFVNDYNNSRVLVWNEPPTMSGVSADAVIGKSNFSSTLLYEPTPRASTFSQNLSLVLHGKDLWVADYVNARVLRFKEIDP